LHRGRTVAWEHLKSDSLTVNLLAIRRRSTIGQFLLANHLRHLNLGHPIGSRAWSSLAGKLWKC
jgi:hypothetical protein